MFGPIPAWVWRLRIWGRVIAAAFLPFWLYTPLFAGWWWLTDGGIENWYTLLLSGTAAILAIGAFPLATWPCRWEIRLPLVTVYAAAQAALGLWWSLFLADWL